MAPSTLDNVRAALDKADAAIDSVNSKIDAIYNGGLGAVLLHLPGIGSVVGIVKEVLDAVIALADAVRASIDKIDDAADKPAAPPAAK